MQYVPMIGQYFLKALAEIKYGAITVETPEGEIRRFVGAEPGPEAHVKLKNWDTIQQLLVKGDVGFAEDYMDGEWETNDLPALLTFATTNVAQLENFFHGKWWFRVYIAFRHLLRRNSKSGSRKNIRAHYDLGNDFYSLWLDKTMTYSSALFAEKEASLEAAQRAKYQRILDRLDAKPGQHILEIGCGWGGFAEMAAERGLKVTGLTLSTEQLAFARERLAKKGFAEQVNLMLTDYRDMNQTFDHIVSIEMFEAVGRQYWPIYFSMVKRCLKPGGKAVIQTITIDDAIFEDYASRSDFIQQYTFPGGMLASLPVFAKEAQKAGLKLKEAFEFGHDYAKTLAHWLHAFDQALPKIQAMGYKDTFLRMWRFYLSYCIAGFSSKRTDVMQAELVHA